MRRSAHTLLSYLSSMNRFVDTNGCIIHDLSEVFDTWQLDQWKRGKESAIVMDKDGKLWRLEYLTPYEEDDVYMHLSWNEHYGIPVVRDEY